MNVSKNFYDHPSNGAKQERALYLPVSGKTRNRVLAIFFKILIATSKKLSYLMNHFLIMM